MLRSGSMVWLIRSAATWAIHCLNGSAFLEGMDWIMRNIPSRLAKFSFWGPPGVRTTRGVDNLSPPFGKFRFAASHLWKVIFWILCFGEYQDYIFYREIPFLVALNPYCPDFLVLKQLYFLYIRHSLSIFCKDNSNGGLMQIFARLNRLFHFANCETIWEVWG